MPCMTARRLRSHLQDYTSLPVIAEALSAFVTFADAFCDTLRQQYRRRLHPLHVSLNILSHINNLDDAIAFLFPSTVLADPVVCLKRALTLNNSYVDEFDILPTDSDEVMLHVLQCRQGTADHPEATPDFLATLSQNGSMSFVSRKDAFTH
ncbi:hypothetical protein M405DRAFT_592614 [Rhizopogon salebrosus TDB-379]|nr:hypothetical protein M405DRAFT_592614 [Rhizopogon salebrosus TDB-379]